MIAQVIEFVRSARVVLAALPETWVELQEERVENLRLWRELVAAEAVVSALVGMRGECSASPVGDPFCAAHNSATPCPVQAGREWLDVRSGFIEEVK